MMSLSYFEVTFGYTWYRIWTVYKDKVRVGEKLFIPGPAYFWSVECELKSDKRL